MDINIIEMVSKAFGGLIKIASKDNISNAEELIAKLSKGDKVGGNNVINVLKGLISDIHVYNKKEKVASLVEDMVNFAQIDESDVDTAIEKFASLNEDEITLEKKALHLSIDNYTNKSNLFTKISDFSGKQGKHSLDSFLI